MDLKSENWIGSGSYGDVYKILVDETFFVIKVMKGEIDDVQKAEYQKECKILEKLNHSNIVTYIRTSIIDKSGRFGIVMEYCERGNLTNLIFDPKCIYSMKSVADWGEELFSALAYLHDDDRKLVHRDLTPSNVFVKEDFSLKIGDFGLGKENEETCTGTLIGTFRYMSPPEITSDPSTQNKISPRNDVYALGLILWELIERRTVFSQYTRSYGFDRDRFILDFYSKVIVEIEPPSCGNPIKNLVINLSRW